MEVCLDAPRNGHDRLSHLCDRQKTHRTSEKTSKLALEEKVRHEKEHTDVKKPALHITEEEKGIQHMVRALEKYRFSILLIRSDAGASRL